MTMGDMGSVNKVVKVTEDEILITRDRKRPLSFRYLNIGILLAAAILIVICRSGPDKTPFIPPCIHLSCKAFQSSQRMNLYSSLEQSRYVCV